MHVLYNLYHQLCDGVHNVSTFSQSYIWEYFVKLTFAVWKKIFLLRFAGWMRLRTQEDAGVRIQQCDAEGSNETKLKTKKWSEMEKQLGKLKVTAMDQHEGDVL